jgi:hypothetical protein
MIAKLMIEKDSNSQLLTVDLQLSLITHASLSNANHESRITSHGSLCV